MKKLNQEINRPITQLIRDFEKRWQLDRTLVIIASEFCRDMMIEGVQGLRPGQKIKTGDKKKRKGKKPNGSKNPTKS